MVSDIPQDVLYVAEEVWLTLPGFVGRDAEIELIARAILDERERCAKVADGLRGASTPGMPLFGAGMCNAADQIAITIRNAKLAPETDTDGIPFRP